MTNNIYLKFDKNRMVNLEYSLEREILRTNRRGAYHCTTLVECNTRKQHGLLVAPVPALGENNHVLLSSLDETVIQHGAEFNLGIHKYDGDNYSPMGHKYIREFSCDSLPKTVYRVGGVVLSKEKMFSLRNNSIYIRYTLLEAHSPTIIRFRPFLAFREANQLTVMNSVANHGYKETKNGISMCMYSGYPNLYMQFDKKANFVFDPHWNKGIEYIKDKEQGLPYKEDLYVPGYFELPIKKGESIVFSASDTEIESDNLENIFEKGIKARTPRSSFFNCLKNSANQFYFRPSADELYLLNNYPWGYVNAQDQFAALSGLTLSIGQYEDYEKLIDTAIPSIKELIAGKPITGFLKDIDAPDVLLWLLKSLKHYSSINIKNFHLKYQSLVVDIINFILSGKHPNLCVLTNGLLSISGRYAHTLRLNCRYEDGSFAYSRSGCLVEINSFWYDSLMFCCDVAKVMQEKKLVAELEKRAEKTKKSFCNTFINESGYLYDYVDGNYVDWRVRPNMLYAITTNYPLLEKKICKSILDIVTKELLTPKGLRLLSPKSPEFKPRHEGSIYDKLHCTFNGSALPGLYGVYMEAYLKVFQRSGYAFLDRLLIGIEEEMANDCIGSLSEIYDGSLPNRGHGAISNAINIAGILKSVAIQKSLEEDY